MSNSFVRAAALARKGSLAASLLICVAASAQTSTVRAAINEQAGSEAAARQTQEQINKIDDATRDAVYEYRATLQETESLQRYNQQLEAQVKSQQDEMVSMQKQIEQIEITSREILPLLMRMLETMEQFVKLDIPFLPDERSKRIAGLKDMMVRADVSIAEKYRRIVEAYQVEMEYGRTLESYEGKIGDRTVSFVRIGRVALMYQTLDGDETGYWDAEKKAWQVDNDYKDHMKAALKMAKKQSAPDLMIVPIAAPKESK